MTNFIVFLVPVDADDILRLDVQVDDAPGVQVGQPCQTFLTVTNTLSSFSTSKHSQFLSFTGFWFLVYSLWLMEHGIWIRIYGSFLCQGYAIPLSTLHGLKFMPHASCLYFWFIALNPVKYIKNRNLSV